MAETFGHHPWTVQDLVGGVSSGRIRLPDIQRPFVWSNAKVRDLIDSMYQGYPVGELMFWQNADEEHSRAIGSDDKTQGAAMQVIDGQQRLTSLYAVVKDVAVLRDDYSHDRIVVAFNPLIERFAVPDSAIKRSSEWIQDIREVFDSPIDARTDYLEKLEERHGGERLPRETERHVENAINRLNRVLSYQFQVVQLKDTVSREIVADIFVRINSEGVKLSSSDFILTWLSVFWEQGREELEEFAKASRFSPQELSSIFGTNVSWTPKNAFITLSTGNVLRVVVAVGNKRAQLQDAYNALRGRDRRTRKIVPEEREKQLEMLKSGQGRALNPTHWDEFLKVLERAGIRTHKMVTSKNAVLFGYAIWLIGRTEFGVPVDELRELMARWYFMAQVTGRYSGSAETRGQEDLNRLNGLERTVDAFKASINLQISTTMTDDWWRVTLPEDLHTSNASGPAYTAYLAALNILNAEALLSTLSVKDWLDPSRRPMKGVERHHLFPRQYLKDQLGYSTTRQINQVANQALVEWSDNIQISDHAPSIYWSEQIRAKNIGDERLKQQRWWHALPENWTELDYEEFLDKRRNLIAAIIREGFKKLSDPNYRPASPVSLPEVGPALPTFEELVHGDILPAGTFLIPSTGESGAVAQVTEDGSIHLEDEEYDTPELAANADGAHDVDGWEYWAVGAPDGKTLEELRLSVSSLSLVK